MAESEEDAELLKLIDRVYDNPEETELWQRVKRDVLTDTLRKARKNNDVATANAATGLSNDRVDAADTLTDHVRELFRPTDRDHMLNLVIYAPPPPRGPTGVGKSEFAYTVVERGSLAYRMDTGDELQPASNNTTDPWTDVESWTGLEDWLEETDGPKVFVFDEAAQELQYADMNEGKALSKLIKLLRKHNCHLILIGHTGRDIPKDVRRMVMFCRKTSKKKAEIGVGLTENQAGHMVIDDVLMRFEGIPPANTEYDDKNDEGTFDFDLEDEDDVDDDKDGGIDPARENAIRAYDLVEEAGMSLSEAAEVMDMSKEGVRRAKEREEERREG